jgi:hypothetical protein
MRITRVWIAAFVLSAVLTGSARQPPCCFSVLNPAGKPVMAAKLGDAPYKPGMDAEPSVECNLDGKKPVLDKKRQVISGFRFYGWSKGANIRIVVAARLPPDGAENRFYRWPELKRAGLKPRYEVFATYTLRAGETRSMDELKALGVNLVTLRAEATPPSH